MTKLYKEKRITNDIILRIMQETYLFNARKVDVLISELFFRYINILEYINMRLLHNPCFSESRKLFFLIEEARAILYFIGNFFTESFGREAIERRLFEMNIEPLTFYNYCDYNNVYKYDSGKNYPIIDRKLKEIIEFYLVLKKWKQKLPTKGKLYLDEDYFNDTKTKITKLLSNQIKIEIKPNEWFWLKQ